MLYFRSEVLQDNTDTLLYGNVWYGVEEEEEEKEKEEEEEEEEKEELLIERKTSEYVKVALYFFFLSHTHFHSLKKILFSVHIDYYVLNKTM